MRRRTANPGFTLIELLVVIFIITLLIGLLIPVVSRVRSAAHAADSKQTISRLASAIESYYAEFRAYPGPFGNAQIGTTPALGGVSLSGAGGAVTQSESLVLALVGGLDFVASGGSVTSFTYDVQQVGQGPKALNFLAATSKRYKPFFVLNTSDLSSSYEIVTLPGTNKLNGLGSDIPEFVDRYPEPLPVLYLRAIPGNTGVSDSGNNTAQYNENHLTPYLNLTQAFGGGKDFASAAAYLTNPDLAGQPRQKDGYMLISAGPDRLFGTNDDICNFGNPKH